MWAPALVLGVAMYWSVGKSLYVNWTLADSYYSHGFLIPPISLFLVWRERKALAAAPPRGSLWGIPVLVGACLFLLAADFLGFTVFAQLALLPTVAGLVLVILGWGHLRILWFAIFFLIFMIPIPPSLTQSIVLDVKLLATEASVQLARLVGLPLVRDGSYVYWSNDRLLVGEVCGGLRSLIALLSFGTLMSYISKTKLWAKYVILALAAPIAVVSNIARIFTLCVIGYTWGSPVATGKVHDVSGILIFAVAFLLLFLLEGILRKLAPAAGGPAEEKESGQ